MRARWWDAAAATYPELSVDASLAQSLPHIELDRRAQRHAPSKPTFFGHYWMKGTPKLQGPNAVCVDYSAGRDGPLVAYRWEEGEPLSDDRFFWVR